MDEWRIFEYATDTLDDRCDGCPLLQQERDYELYGEHIVARIEFVCIADKPSECPMLEEYAKDLEDEDE